MPKVKHQNCDGCAASDDRVEDCRFYNDNKNGDCPCTACLVKTMCKCNSNECGLFVIWMDGKPAYIPSFRKEK